MTATLMKSGSNQCALNDRRAYDAWGGVRTGNTSGEPHGRYCANLGHLADDESGFTYMRARYYEPGTGRFVSEDPARDGINSFGYCHNNPVRLSDQSGKKPGDYSYLFSGVGWGFIAMAMIICQFSANPGALTIALNLTAIGIACVSFSAVMGLDDTGMKVSAGAVGAAMAAGLFYSAREMSMLSNMVSGAAIGAKSAAGAAVMACFAYQAMLFSVMKEGDWADMGINFVTALAVPGPPF